MAGEDETLRLISESERGTLVALWEGGTVTHPLPRTPTWVVGRGGGADVPLEHISISRTHASIRVAEGSVHVTDLGSSNGTRVRGRTLSNGESASVAYGEAFELGKLVLMVRPRHPQSENAGVDPASVSPMQEVWRLVDLVAPTDIGVLLLGETGAGKGYLAERIHQKSPRAAGPFVQLNCAAFPAHLLESELFGHERGSFTGAGEAKPGLFETAAGGTLFLDEIAEVAPEVQAKLLLALERGEILRVGALRSRPIDARIVAATNRPVSAEQPEPLRPDLYFRLASLPITVPPLRERRDEIPSLALTLLTHAAQSLGRRTPTLGQGVLASLIEYAWPGNVREMAAILQRAALCCDTTLEVRHLSLPTGAANATLHRLSIPPVPQEGSEGQVSVRLGDEISALERQRIVNALDRAGGNQSRAAEALGIARRTLINRMISFGIPRPRKG